MLVVSVLQITTAEAKVKALKLQEVVKDADFIGIVEVTSIMMAQKGRRVATAKVVALWKGNVTETVQFLAEPTWECDVSDAKAGERIVLFASKGSGNKSVSEIAHSGRGRMPITDKGEKTVCLCSYDIILPKGSRGPESPNIGESATTLVTVEELKRLVEQSKKK